MSLLIFFFCVLSVPLTLVHSGALEDHSEMYHKIFWETDPAERQKVGEKFTNMTLEITKEAKKKAIENGKKYCKSPENLIKEWDKLLEEELAVAHEGLGDVVAIRNEAQAKAPAEWSEHLLKSLFRWENVVKIIRDGNVADARKILKEEIPKFLEFKEKLDKIIAS